MQVGYLRTSSLLAFMVATAQPTPPESLSELDHFLHSSVKSCHESSIGQGDQYDVREKSDGGQVRNHGKPVALAERYYQDGADEAWS